MKARFIGQDGSMGLKNGTVYNLQAKTPNIMPKQAPIEIIINNDFYDVICPYGSLEKLFENWEFNVKTKGRKKVETNGSCSGCVSNTSKDCPYFLGCGIERRLYIPKENY